MQKSNAIALVIPLVCVASIKPKQLFLLETDKFLILYITNKINTLIIYTSKPVPYPSSEPTYLGSQRQLEVQTIADTAQLQLAVPPACWAAIALGQQ
jgi:hypothetical protein